MISSNSTLFQPDRRGYDPQTDTYHAHHEWESPNSLSYTVCRAIAAVTGDDAAATSLLTDAVDPDALDRLFRDRRQAGSSTDYVTMNHEEYTVTVYRNGHVVVRLLDGD